MTRCTHTGGRSHRSVLRSMAASGVAITMIACPSARGVVHITGIGAIGGPSYGISATAVSADGTVVAGESGAGPFLTHAFRWSAAQGRQDLGTIGGGANSFARGVSADGATIVGMTNFNASASLHAFSWTAPGGMLNLGALGNGNSYANAISGDASRLGGGTGGIQRAFIAPPTGPLQDLGLAGTGYSTIWGISADGSAIAGNVSANTGASPRAFRWTQAGGAQDLGTLTPDGQSIGYAISADGAVVAGSSNVNGAPHAFAWAASSGMEDLGTLGGPSSEAFGISGDGRLVVGHSVDQSGQTRAFFWTRQLGMWALNDYLPLIGVDLNGWTFGSARAISADGSTIVGSGRFNGENVAFVVSGLSIPSPAAVPSLAFIGAGLLSRRRR